MSDKPEPLTAADFQRYRATLLEIGERLGYGLRNAEHRAIAELVGATYEIEAGER